MIKQPNHDWKAVAYVIGNVPHWGHQGSLDTILESDASVDDTSREAIDIIRTLQMTAKRLPEYTIDEDQSVAVVGYD